MTRTFSADGNNDLYLGPDGALAIVADKEAVMQAAQQAAQTQLGEMIYAVDQGLPNFGAVWNGAPNLSQFEAYLRRTILAVAHVVGIQSLTITARDNTLFYVAEIETDYGPGVLSNG